LYESLSRVVCRGLSSPVSYAVSAVIDSSSVRITAAAVIEWSFDGVATMAAALSNQRFASAAGAA